MNQWYQSSVGLTRLRNLSLRIEPIREELEIDIVLIGTILEPYTVLKRNRHICESIA